MYHGTAFVSYSNGHSFVGYFRCDQCLSRCYKNKKSLLRHQRYECHKDPTFSCPYCAHKAKYRNNLFSHIRQRHRDVVCTSGFLE